ncbi:33456_t:CDS:2 [Gigaspora margarita]|uniref:33456_t:CDS:1 n=1 Tax=Gigaspora margarita TaxID=4874 RepID=A0ABM8W6W9_GIGMA|nr:33456_t:CDS:2 [Gigaspora margarita]
MSYRSCRNYCKSIKKDKSNIAVRYDGEGWNYYDFKSFLEPYFAKIDVNISNNFSFNLYQPLTVILLKPLKCQTQLFKDIRPYIYEP